MNQNALPGFKICDGKGFHVTFANGFTVSVQFGPGNYCDNYHERFGPDNQLRLGEKGSTTAECACWGPDGNFVVLPGEEHDVTNRSSPADVLRFLQFAAEQSPPAHGEKP